MKTSVQKFTLFLTLIIVSGLLQNLQAQSLRKEGDQAWKDGRYKTAVNKYGLVESLKSDKKLLAKRGEGFFKLNMLDKAVHHFTQAKKLGNRDIELYWMMAQCKHHMEDYDEAAFFYKSYVKEIGEKDSKAKVALRELKNCSYASLQKNSKEQAFVRNFGPEINTYYDELYPIQSPRYGNVYYFTSNRNLKDMDVFSYELNAKGEWQENQDFEATINTNDDQYGMDVSTNGLSMLYATAPQEKPVTKIHVSTFDDQGQQHFIDLPDYIIDGAMDIQILDHNSIAFASKDLGGYGGYDIFTINYQNGIWSDPINAGIPINSKYDERSPCYATTGDYLYFSTNKPYCYGGFDVYYYNLLSITQQPTNLGQPINGPGNDLQFRMNQDGQTAIMSSDRKTGEGAYDLYLVYMNDPKPMPERDKRQLSYVKDYFKELFPDAEPLAAEAAEPTESHLDKLKERLALKKEQTKTTQQSNVEEIEDELVEDEIVEDELLDEGFIEEEALRADPLISAELEENEEIFSEVELSKQEEPTQVEQEPEVTSTIEEIENDVEEVLVEQEDLLAEEQDVTEVVSDVVEKVEEQEVVEQVVYEEEIAEEVEEAQAKQKIVKAEPSAVTSNSSIPDKESGESPLHDLQTARKKQNSLPKVQPISGEKIKYALLYQDRHDLMNKVNKAKMEELLAYLKANRDHHLHIIAHTDHLEPGLPEFMQYNTLKRANYLGRYLLENNIPKSQISIESVCANYPMARPEISGVLNTEYLSYNKRIEFEIMDREGIVLASHNIDTAGIPHYAIDTKYELFSQVREELYYSVEIATSNHIYKNAVLRLYDNIYIRKSDPLADNKYYIGIFSTYEEVQTLQAELAESSAPYAKIKAFYRGMPVRPEKYDVISAEYPNFKLYLASSVD